MERELFELPVRYDRHRIVNPSKITLRENENSNKVINKEQAHQKTLTYLCLQSDR